MSTESGRHDAADALIADLIANGFDEASAVSRASLLGAAEEGLRTHVPAGPEWRWIVPGRIEVFGKHTDYAGGRSLVATVPRGVAVVVRRRFDGRVRIIDARYGDIAVLSADGVAHPRRGWTNYASVVMRRLASNFPGADLGADIAIASDLPRAAGLSSSSALVIGIASALIRRAGLEARDEWRAEITTALDLAGYLGCVENGLTFRTLSGADGVGTEGGSEDHTAILASRPGVVSQFSFMPVRHQGDNPMPDDWRFIVASSGVHADKAGTVRDRYNRSSRLVRALVAAWNRLGANPDVSLAAALATNPHAEDRLRSALMAGEPSGFSAEELSRRLDHFVREDARVPAAAESFRAADAHALGAMAAASQDDAEALLGNQVPETVALVDLARRCGAWAATSFGAGFGGSAWALVPAQDVERFGPAWMAAYRARYPHLTRVEWFAARPAPPVVELGKERL